MDITDRTRVGDIVRSNFSTASVFTRMHIDYCCGGNRTLGKACAEAGADVNHVIRKLEHAKKPVSRGLDNVQKLPPGELCHYIVRTHHGFTRAQIPVLIAGLKKLVDVHGFHDHDLKYVRELFLDAATELVKQMQKEEMILFPYVHHMSFCEQTGEKLMIPSFGSVTNPVHMLISDHKNESERFREIRKAAGDYLPPGDACDTRRATWKMLEDFEDDLHRHFHLENNVLFPMVIKMEKQLLRK